MTTAKRHKQPGQEAIEEAIQKAGQEAVELAEALERKAAEVAERFRADCMRNRSAYAGEGYETLRWLAEQERKAEEVIDAAGDAAITRRSGRDPVVEERRRRRSESMSRWVAYALVWGATGWLVYVGPERGWGLVVFVLMALMLALYSKAKERDKQAEELKQALSYLCTASTMPSLARSSGGLRSWRTERALSASRIRSSRAAYGKKELYFPAQALAALQRVPIWTGVTASI